VRYTDSQSAVRVSPYKIERRGIDAITKSRRSWSVRKNVAEVAIALATADFRAHHPMAAVFDLFDRTGGYGGEIAGPTSAGIKFRLGIEKRRGTTNAYVLTVRLVIPIFARECSFGTATPSDLVLFGRKRLAVFVVGLATVAHDDPRGSMVARNRAMFEPSQARFFLLSLHIVGA